MSEPILEAFARDNFANRSNQIFRIHFTAEEAVDCELIEVSELRKQIGGESFSIVFLAPLTAPVEQQIYRIDHPEMGSFELFLVPVGKDDKGVKYEAVFNLRRG